MAEPRRPLTDLSDAELEQALTGLGSAIAFPPTPDLASRVRVRLDAAPGPPPAQIPRQRTLWLAAAALLVVILGALALFPDARTAIADRLGLRGVSIQWLEEIPTPPPSPVGAAPLELGRPLTLAEARDEVPFTVDVPTAAGFSDPTEVYLLGTGREAMVSFVYPEQPGLPESGVPGVGALLTQFRGDADRNLVEKGLRGDDNGAETHIEALSVNGEPGFWITGAPHGVYFVCYDVGECRQEPYRLAGNVLLWERGDVTLRLESALGKDESMAIAQSVRPPE